MNKNTNIIASNYTKYYYDNCNTCSWSTSTSSSRGGAASKVGLPLPPSTGVEALALLGPVEGTLDGGTKNSGTQGTKTKSHDASVQGLVAGQGRCVATQEELLVNIS